MQCVYVCVVSTGLYQGQYQRPYLSQVVVDVRSQTTIKPSDWHPGSYRAGKARQLAAYQRPWTDREIQDIYKGSLVPRPIPIPRFSMLHAEFYIEKLEEPWDRARISHNQISCLS